MECNDVYPDGNGTAVSIFVVATCEKREFHPLIELQQAATSSCTGPRKVKSITINIYLYVIYIYISIYDMIIYIYDQISPICF